MNFPEILTYSFGFGSIAVFFYFMWKDTSIEQYQRKH